MASIKKVINNEPLTITFDPERFEALGTLHTLIQVAYDLRDFQLEKSRPGSRTFSVSLQDSGTVPVHSACWQFGKPFS